MSRVNVGIEPKFLSDQHLIAESVEITMIVGSLKRDKWYIKGQVPTKFCLGQGHINFFKPKLLYLKDRLEEVNIDWCVVLCACNNNAFLLKNVLFHPLCRTLIAKD